VLVAFEVVAIATCPILLASPPPVPIGGVQISIGVILDRAKCGLGNAVVLLVPAILCRVAVLGFGAVRL
jgi:hypothetical protein